jgi:hypothetical protein
MIWTTLYFMHQRDTWYSRLLQIRTLAECQPGKVAYCEEKIAHWEEFARLAAFNFRNANPDFPDIWRPIVTCT